MKNQLHLIHFIKVTLVLVLFNLVFNVNAQLPNPALIGYWQNWNDASAPYIPLDSIDSRYNVIEVSFAIPETGTDYKMVFEPDGATQAALQTKILSLQAQGKRVLISIGGANGIVKLDNIAERDTFVTRMTGILNTYNFDGMDLDLEGASVSVSGGTIANPTDQPIINLINGVKQIMTTYRANHNKKMLLTMAPETAFVQGGMSAYGSIWGAYLPIINGLRDSLDVLQVQLYNSGSMTGIDGANYSSATADFIIAMTEAVIHGFNTTGGQFNGLPASKVAVGLPACTSAAGSGFTDTATVKHAIDYLRGTGSKPGSYTLATIGGYPTLRGMMTWSINWDKSANCNSVYEYAANFQRIFNGVTTSINENNKLNDAVIYPIPAKDILTIDINSNEKIKEIIIYNNNSQKVLQQQSSSKSIDVTKLSAGLYVIHVVTDHLIINKKISILH